MRTKIDLRHLPRERLEAMETAGGEILGCYRALQKAGENVVGQCLAHQGTFYELEHYPKDDEFDADTHSRYYHFHRPELGEHGHFHTFLRANEMPNVGKWAQDHPNNNVYEDHNLVVTSITKIDAPKKIASMKRALKSEKQAA